MCFDVFLDLVILVYFNAISVDFFSVWEDSVVFTRMLRDFKIVVH